MKIKKIYEDNSNPYEELENAIYDIIRDRVDIRPTPFGDDGQYEVDYRSEIAAAKDIVEYLKTQGLANILDIKKYNL